MNLSNVDLVTLLQKCSPVCLSIDRIVCHLFHWWTACLTCNTEKKTFVSSETKNYFLNVEVKYKSTKSNLKKSCKINSSTKGGYVWRHRWYRIINLKKIRGSFHSVQLSAHFGIFHTDGISFWQKSAQWPFGRESALRPEGCEFKSSTESY